MGSLSTVVGKQEGNDDAASNATWSNWCTKGPVAESSRLWRLFAIDD